MPTYAYKCEECNTRYEVFHKVKEETDSIICPNCSSHAYRKVMSVTGISTSSSKGISDMPTMPSCPSGGCAGGFCGLN